MFSSQTNRTLSDTHDTEGYRDMGESEQQDGGTGGFQRISSIRLDDGTDDGRAASGGEQSVRPYGTASSLHMAVLGGIRTGRI